MESMEKWYETRVSLSFKSGWPIRASKSQLLVKFDSEVFGRPRLNFIVGQYNARWLRGEIRWSRANCQLYHCCISNSVASQYSQEILMFWLVLYWLNNSLPIDYVVETRVNMAPQRSKKTPADSTEGVATQQNGDPDEEDYQEPASSKGK